MSSSTSSFEPAARVATLALLIGVLGFELLFSRTPEDQGRHEVDDIFASLPDAHTCPPVLVLSDSVTFGVLAPDPRWFDGTSNAAIGTAGNFFLVTRVIDRGCRPQHVVLIEHPSSLAEDLRGPRSELYFTSIFYRRHEEADLRRRLPSRTELADAMAVARWSRILSPPSAWRSGALRRPLEERVAQLAVTEERDATAANAAAIDALLSARSEPALARESAVYRDALGDLSEQTGFALHFVEAPRPPTIAAAWEGSWGRLWQTTCTTTAQGRSRTHCVRSSEIWVPSDDESFRDGVHLTRAGKRQYRRGLEAFLQGLPVSLGRAAAGE